MTDKKHRITVDLNQEEYENLILLKNSMDRSLSWLGRRAISDFLQKNLVSKSKSSDSSVKLYQAESVK